MSQEPIKLPADAVEEACNYLNLSTDEIIGLRDFEEAAVFLLTLLQKDGWLILPSSLLSRSN